MYKAVVVDDEKMIREGIKHAINWKEIGIEEVFTAASAKEALSILDTHHPEIMITDINMTEMSGLELIEAVRKDNKDLQITVLTGYDRFDYARRCLHMRVQNFLLKPVDEEELTESLRLHVKELDEIKDREQKERNQWRTAGTRQQIFLETFMQDLVHRRFIEEEKYKKFFGEFGFLREQILQVAILLPDLYLHQEQTEGSYRVLTVKNICIDLIDIRNAGITFSDDDGKIILVFFTEAENVDVTEKIRQLNDILEDEYNMKSKAVLGSDVKGFDALHISYNDAQYLLENKKESFLEIVKTKHDQSREEIFREIFMELKNSMITNIADGEHVLHVFETFKKAADSYKLSQNHIRRCCFELASAVSFAYTQETGEMSDSRLGSFMQSLSRADTEGTCEMTSLYLHQLLASKESGKHDIVTKAKLFIDEHLDEELSVASIAADLYVSPNYFSRLFKRIMKEGCNEYIVRKRIEKAKSLLETTNFKAGKIALMVGYRDTNYFSLAFKKYTGTSPTRYRETHGSHPEM